MANLVATAAVAKIVRPVRVWNHHTADFTGPSKENISRTVPARGFVVLDRNEASVFIHVPSPRWDAEGNVTPKALTYCCDICCLCVRAESYLPAESHTSPYPPKDHACFKDLVSKLGIKEGIEPCDKCGEKFERIVDAEAHAAAHAGGVLKDVEKTPPTQTAPAMGGEVAALKAEVGALKDMFKELLLPLAKSVGDVYKAETIRAEQAEVQARGEIEADSDAECGCYSRGARIWHKKTCVEYATKE